MADVLNAGRVELVDSMGSDMSVVRAARISNGAAMPEWRGAPDERLIQFLAKNKHLSPFEHATFTFYVKAPIFVIREWQRHRTLSYNELSARYKELKPEFFMPDAPRVQDPKNKQSSVEVDAEAMLVNMRVYMRHAYEQADEWYRKLLAAGIAREIARSVLPVGIYSEMYVTGNFRNWMQWFDLRSTPEAQAEIRQYAYAIAPYLVAKMPLSFQAWMDAR